MRSLLYIIAVFAFSMILFFLGVFISDMLIEKDTLEMEETTSLGSTVVEREKVAVSLVKRTALFTEYDTTAILHPEVDTLLSTEEPATIDLANKTPLEWYEEFAQFLTEAEKLEAFREGMNTNEKLIRKADTRVVRERPKTNFTNP